MAHRQPKIERAEQTAGGWGSVEAVSESLLREHVFLKGARVILKQNKPDGYACVSCSWAKPAHPHSIEACENGIKATAWEITARRAPPEFFAEHPGWAAIEARVAAETAPWRSALTKIRLPSLPS